MGWPGLPHGASRDAGRCLISAVKVVIVLDLCGLSAEVHRFWPTLEALEGANATATPRSEVWVASSSPVMPEAWVVAMQHHPDQRFATWLRRGLIKGFRIGYGGPAVSRTRAGRNLPSARKHPAVVDDYQAKEIVAGRLVGPVPADQMRLVRLG